MPLTKRTARAVEKHGADACGKAFIMNCKGYRAKTIAFEGPSTIRTIRTTHQADAAIDAGRELAKRRRAAPHMAEPPDETMVS